jgi:hypothetical protein
MQATRSFIGASFLWSSLGKSEEKRKKSRFPTSDGSIFSWKKS